MTDGLYDRFFSELVPIMPAGKVFAQSRWGDLTNARKPSYFLSSHVRFNLTSNRSRYLILQRKHIVQLTLIGVSP